jgi:hypothetical protein
MHRDRDDAPQHRGHRDPTDQQCHAAVDPKPPRDPGRPRLLAERHDLLGIRIRIRRTHLRTALP